MSGSEQEGAESASRTSTRDPKSAYERGGQCSHGGAERPTKDQLCEEARKRRVHGRSPMTKQEPKSPLGR